MAPSDEGKLLAADESRLFFTDKTASSEGRGGGGGGGLPHKSDCSDHRKIWKEPLKGIRILFYGRGLNNF